MDGPFGSPVSPGAATTGLEGSRAATSGYCGAQWKFKKHVFPYGRPIYAPDPAQSIPAGRRHPQRPPQSHSYGFIFHPRLGITRYCRRLHGRRQKELWRARVGRGRRGVEGRSASCETLYKEQADAVVTDGDKAWSPSRKVIDHPPPPLYRMGRAWLVVSWPVVPWRASTMRASCRCSPAGLFRTRCIHPAALRQTRPGGRGTLVG